MFDFEDNSIESKIIRLQNMGLAFNELKSNNGTVSYAAYESLLEYTISILQDFDNYSKRLQKLFAERK